ncbi:MAG: hypothetical protein NTV80_00025, partial [Verrucomicrobia bacterium]|nr:hypothetical protein [Verrucomicrobiota bacterium]
NGRIIPGQTGFTLEIPEARPKDAGHYQARVADAEGNSGISRKTPVVIVESQEEKNVIFSSHSLMLPPRFWGPVDRIFWMAQERFRQPKVLKETWWARGTQTARLRLLSYFMLPDTIYCMAGVGESDIQLGSFGFDYSFYGATPRFYAGPEDVDATVGAEIGQPNLYVDTGMILVSGMPPGVTSMDGRLNGAPTKAGNYRLQWKLLNAAGHVTDTSQSWVFVRDPKKPAPGVVPGLWAGEVVGGFGEIPVRGFSAGLIEVQTSAQGVFSGSLRLGHRRWPLAGALRWDGEFFQSRVVLTPPAGVKLFACVLQGYTDNPFLTVSFEVEFTQPLGEDAARWELYGNLLSPRTPDSADVLRPAGLGRITALLQTNVLQTGEIEDGYVLGHGFMTAVPAQRLQRMNVIGTLPDGSGIMGSMPVVSGQPFSVIFYHPLQKNGENLQGRLDMVGVPWYISDEPVLQGNLTWQRLPVQGKGWVAGRVKEWPLSVTGELFFQPDAGPLLPSRLPGTETFVRLNGGSAFANFIPRENIPFDLKPDHQAVFPKPDPRSFKLDIYAPTGFFTGSFKLLEGGEGKTQHSRTMKFRGRMVPGLSRGGGFFHFKAPASSADDASVFYSGALDIFRADDELSFEPPASTSPKSR